MRIFNNIILFLFLISLINGCSSSIKTEQTKELMGTFVTITVYDEDYVKAEEAIGLAFKEIERIDYLLSSYKNESEVFQLNEEGYIGDASADLIYNLERAKYYGDLSNGSFDITVKPILDLYSESFKELGKPPIEKQINKTLLYVDYSKIVVKGDMIILPDKMGITLGGIAKGYAIDKAIMVLKNRGIKHALVNAGGDMGAIGSKGEGDWQIALQNPRDSDEYITLIKLNDAAVATSGDYERYFDESKKFHHIVDPRTGYSATELISVTIVAGNAMDADAIATSVFVLGSKGMDLIESIDGVEGLIITSDKEIIKSSGFD